MAKVAKPKKREPTVHSRAHRRNASPPPKDLAVKAPAAEEESEYKPWLHNAQNAGISKRKKVKQMSRQQKVRQQKAMDKADANLDKLATKVMGSKARGRKVQARRAEWEDLNGSAKETSKGADEMQKDEDEEAAEDGEKAVELDIGMAESDANAEKAAESDANPEKAAEKDVPAEAVTLPEPQEDEEL